MARRKSGTLTDLELEIMQVLWREGETTVEVIRGLLDRRGRSLALPSVRTMLLILQEKGYLTRRRAGRCFFYRPVVSEDQAHKGLLGDLINRAFEGSASQLIAALVNNRLVSKKELRRVKVLIEQHEKKVQS